MKKKFISSIITAVLILSLFAGFKKPDAGINPPKLPISYACILIAHR